MAFDLEQLAAADRPPPTESDLEILRGILTAARSLPATGRPSDLEKALAGIVPSNKDERRTLLALLGYAGILQPRGRPGFLHGFVNFEVRAEMTRSEWPYPVCWWRGGDSVCQDALEYWFPELT